MEPGTYRIWLFEGNIIPEDGDLIPDDFGPHLGMTPLEVTTTGDGRFGTVVGDWATPVLIWDACEYTPPRTDYTIILDQIMVGVGPGAESAPNQGVWGEEDYRDDLCTAVPTPQASTLYQKWLLGQ